MALPPTTKVNTISTHTAPVNAITFSSQTGTYTLTGSSDRQVHLSRTEPSSSKQTSSTGPPVTTTPIQKYASHGYPVLSIAVTQDNNSFASVGGDRSVFLWDVQNSESTVRRLGSNTSQAHTSRINCVAFAADDAVCVSGSDDRTVRLWDMKSRDARPLLVLEDAKDGISALVTHGVEVISGSVDGRVRNYDVRMGRVTSDVFPGAVTSLAISADTKLILVGCLDGRLRVMDRSDGTCLRVFPADVGGDGYVNENLRLRSCFAVDEKIVLSGSESDGTVRAWDVMTGQCVGKVDVSEKGKVISVVTSRAGSVAQNLSGLWAAGGADGVVRLYSN